MSRRRPGRTSFPLSVWALVASLLALALLSTTWLAGANAAGGDVAAVSAGGESAYDAPATSTTRVTNLRIDALRGQPIEKRGWRSATSPLAPRLAAKGRPQVNWDGQTKHFLGHNSYTQGRSQLTADPRKLIERAGSGQPVGSVSRGQPGFRERIDLGEQIGTYIDPVTGAELATSRGILHYGNKGVHIVPARP